MIFHEINVGSPHPLVPSLDPIIEASKIIATPEETSNNSVCKIYIYYTLIHDTQPCPHVKVYFVVWRLHLYQNFKFQMFIYLIFCKESPR